MLQVTIPEAEYFDSEKNIFIYIKQQILTLEHSLVSISKWEQKWNKPFMETDIKTHEESKDYIKCMTLTQNVDPIIYDYIPESIYREIDAYISAPMTATKFREDNNSKNKEIITSELIYYWMITLGIPFECRKWHLNTLIALIKVCEIKNTPPKKMSKNEIMSRNAELNAKRRAAMHSKG